MYVQSFDEQNVCSWVDAVHNLRYKDYYLAASPTAMSKDIWLGKEGFLEEIDTVKAMALRFDEAGLLDWWKLRMGFMKGSDGTTTG